MDKTTLKEYLTQYKYDANYLKGKLNEMENFKQQNAQLKNISEYFTKEKGSELIKINYEFEQNKIDKILKRKQMIENLIEHLSQPYRTILYLYYICFKNFEQIGDVMDYSGKRVYQLYDKGLQNLLQIVNSDSELCEQISKN